MRSRGAQVALTLVCVLLGALLMIQFRTQGKLAKSIVAESINDQMTIITSLYESNLSLRREIDKLVGEAQDFERQHDSDRLEAMVDEINQLRIVTGRSEVSGPGIKLVIHGRLRAEDVLDLINELRNAGAEAIAVGNQRVVARSAVQAYQGQIAVNNTIVESPFVFQAIGHPETLDRALTRKGGLLAYLERDTYPPVTITLTQESRLVLPMYSEEYALQHAQPVAE
jgi:uncharacterized protein YlxW (UPF0749 family)